MPTFDDIKQFLTENEFEDVFEGFDAINLTINQKDDVLRFKQRFNALQDRKHKGLLTREEADVIKNNLTTDILQFIYVIENNEYEPQPKPTFQEKITNIPSKYLLLAILLLEILIGILGELMPDEVKPILEELVGKENYWIAWTIVFVLTIVAFLYLTFRKEKPQAQPTETNFFDEEENKITENLIERYENRLQQKTDKRLPVDLKLTYTKEGTSDEFKHWDKGIRTGKIIKDDWVTILKKHEHILIIGKPGAGKSTQLLELAVAWLKDETCPQIPVVFNLAPWTFDNQHFHEWLQSALVSGYGFSKALAKEAIEKNRILPLLDGLDEVGTKEETEDKKAELRSHCLEAIDRYLSNFNVPYMAICSRIEEFKTAADAPIKAEILINPLTPKQIRQTFINALKDKQNLTNNDENAVNNLRQLLKTHPTLEKVLCTPFYYNIALDVFGGRTQQHDLPDKQGDLERYLVEAFLDKKLVNTENKRGYSDEKTRHYLGFVANVLDLENLKNFELVSFSSKYLSNKKKVNLIYSLSFILMISFVPVFTRSWVSLIFIITIGFIGAFLQMVVSFNTGRFGNNRTMLNEQIMISNNLKLINFIMPPMFILAFYRGADYYFLPTVILLGMLIGTLQLSTNKINIISKPYQKIQKRLTLEIIIWIMIFVLVNIGIQFTEEYHLTIFDWIIGSVIWLFIAFVNVGMLFFSNVSYFNHSILRVSLTIEQKLPLRWVSFFTYATKARILEQDGGQWRFRHQILQDYFLEVWKRRNEEF